MEREEGGKGKQEGNIVTGDTIRKGLITINQKRVIDDLSNNSHQLRSTPIHIRPTTPSIPPLLAPFSSPGPKYLNWTPF